jgi:tetratricopeptide (TPR) repeat protein/CHAT domain-containing protein
MGTAKINIVIVILCATLFWALTNHSAASEMGQLLDEGNKAFEAENYPRAMEIYTRGLELADEANDREMITRFLRHIGAVHQALKQHNQALAYFNKALKGTREINNRNLEGFCLHSLGMSYAALAQYDEALRAFNQALEISREIKNRPIEGAALQGIGIVFSNEASYDQAKQYLQQALAIHQETKDRAAERHVLAVLGMIAAQTGRYDMSLDFHRQALAISRNRQDLPAVATALREISACYTALGQDQQALELLPQALEIHRKIKARGEEADDLLGFGAVYGDLGQFDKSLPYFRQALAIYREIGDRPGEERTLLNLGVLSGNLGNHQEEMSYLQQALAISQEIKNRKGEGEALAGIGNALRQAGQNEEALKAYRESLEIFREQRDRKGEKEALSGIGSVYKELGRYAEAMDVQVQALALARAFVNPPGIILPLTELGRLSLDLRQDEQALDYFQQGLAVARKIKARHNESTILMNLGIAYKRLGRYDQALHCYQESLAIAREVRDRASEGHIFTNLGNIYLELKKFGEAQKNYQSALAIHREFHHPAAEAATLLSMGVAYKALGRYAEAHRALQEGLKISHNLGAPEFLWMIQAELAEVAAKQKNPEAAISHYEESLNIIESLRAGLEGQETKLSFMVNKFSVYDELIVLLQSLHRQDPSKGYDRKALEIFERKQGRILLEEVGKSGATVFRGLPEPIKAKETELENQLTTLQSDRQQLLAQKDPAPQRLHTLEQQLQQTKTQQQSLKAEIKQLYPEYFSLKYPQPANLRELQEKVLRSGEVMLVYGIIGEENYLWVIGRNQLQSFPLNLKRRELGEMVNNYRVSLWNHLEDLGQIQDEGKINQLTAKSRKELRPLQEALAERLLPEEAWRMLGQAQVWYIVPTASLYGLPFESLLIPGKSKPGYLVEKHAIAYLSSASLLKVTRDWQAHRTNLAPYPLLAFANPLYQQASAAPAQISRSRSPLNYKKRLGESFLPLPETEVEVKEIKEILEAIDSSQPLQLGEAASRSTILSFNRQKKLAQYRYLVFACHGLRAGEVENLGQPALVLSHPDPVDKQNGYLTMADVFKLTLNADLVALSACNTGIGELQEGEGMIGLTRAFMYAGTPSVSVTLWPVESESTVKLSTGFFQGLKEGKGRAAALQ